MEEKIFYENPKVKITNFTVETKEFTMPITQVTRVTSRLVGQGGMTSVIFTCIFLFPLTQLLLKPVIGDLWWWVIMFICLLLSYLGYVWISNSCGVVLQTQARPRKYVVVEGIKLKEAEAIKEKITAAMVENMKHR